jgi:hypothetical protein
VVVEVFVAQSQAENPLGQEFVNAMFDPVWITVIDKASGKPTNDAASRLHLPQEESAGIRSDGPTVKSPGDFPPPQGLERGTRVHYTL